MDIHNPFQFSDAEAREVGMACGLALFEAMKGTLFPSSARFEDLSLNEAVWVLTLATQVTETFAKEFSTRMREKRESSGSLLKKKGPDFVLNVNGQEHTFTELAELSYCEGALWFSKQ